MDAAQRPQNKNEIDKHAMNILFLLFLVYFFLSIQERLPAYLLLLFEQFNEDLTFTRRVIKGDFNNPFALPSLRVARFDLCTQMGIRMRAQPNFQRPTTMGR